MMYDLREEYAILFICFICHLSLLLNNILGRLHRQASPKTTFFNRVFTVQVAHCICDTWIPGIHSWIPKSVGIQSMDLGATPPPESNQCLALANSGGFPAAQRGCLQPLRTSECPFWAKSAISAKVMVLCLTKHSDALGSLYRPQKSLQTQLEHSSDGV